MNNKKTIIFMAPLPPPYMGPSTATQIILNSRFVNEFNLIHIDTADRRPLNNLARVDATNIFLAFKHYFLLFIKLVFHNADLVYIPVCQTSIGFLRDVPFIGISKLFSKKVVFHLRGGYFRKFYDSSNKVMKFIVKQTLKRVDRMIVLGDSLKAIFKGLIPEEKLLVVPNGVNISFNTGTNKNPAKNPLKILFLSNFIETKGYWDVLYSIKKVIRYNKRLKYVFAGFWVGDKDRIRCRDYIKRENLGDYVEFEGAVTGREKLRVLKEAEIFVFPTYYPFEGHPWVIVEAMAAGLPIITTDQGCIKESIIDGENGFIILKKDPDALAEKVNYLIKNQRLREEMGRKSRQFYEANFTKEHFVQRMIDAMNHTLH